MVTMRDMVDLNFRLSVWCRWEDILGARNENIKIIVANAQRRGMGT
jgi:hypothetical protein